MNRLHWPAVERAALKRQRGQYARWLCRWLDDWADADEQRRKLLEPERQLLLQLSAALAAQTSDLQHHPLTTGGTITAPSLN